MKYHLTLRGADSQTELIRWANSEGVDLVIGDLYEDFEMLDIDGLGGFYVSKYKKFEVSTNDESIAVMIKLRWGDALRN